MSSESRTTVHAPQLQVPGSNRTDVTTPVSNSHGSPIGDGIQTPVMNAPSHQESSGMPAPRPPNTENGRLQQSAAAIVPPRDMASSETGLSDSQPMPDPSQLRRLPSAVARIENQPPVAPPGVGSSDTTNQTTNSRQFSSRRTNLLRGRGFGCCGDL